MEEKKIRGKNLQSQLAEALRDAAVLQKTHQKERGASFISEMKLVTARIVTLQRMISRRERDSVQPLKNDIARLKQENAALKVELETKTKKSVGPPASAQDPALERVLAEAEQRRRKVSEVKIDSTPLPTKGDSVDAELLERASGRIKLVPPRTNLIPRGEEVVQLLDVPKPVIPPSEVEKKAIASMGSQFPEITEDRIARIQGESRRNAEASRSEISVIAENHTDWVETQERNAALKEKIAKILGKPKTTEEVAN